MKIKYLFLSIFLAFDSFLTTNAQELQQNSTSTVVAAYRFYKDVDYVSIKVPTVVEIPFATDFIERFDFAVFDKTTNSFEPHYFKPETLVNEIPVSVSAIPYTDSVTRIIDKDTRTYTDFLLPNNTQGQVQITLSNRSSFTSSILTILVDSNVALPTYVEIRAFVDGQDRIVVANKKMEQQTIRFPQTTSNRWQISFKYSQPLRITELRLKQNNATKASNGVVRFLAQPSHSYRIYFDPDRSAKAPVGEAGNLALAKDVFTTPASPSQKNPNYVIADVDTDGVPDVRDNCVSISNSDQQDINENGRGDVCDDFDQDGIINSKDNCPDNPNQDQNDADSDGIGDVCDKQESRITEQYPWIPWAGIGLAAVVLIVLLALTARATYVGKQGKDQ